MRILLHATGVFNAAELEVAMELIDIWLDRPEQKDYVAYVAADARGEPVGYVLFGPAPATQGTWDLYWIAVDPAQHQRGIGGRLLKFAESYAADRGLRWMLIETSSLPRYAPTRAFYGRHGYPEIARVREYYAPGDDKIVYGKRFDQAAGGGA